MSLRGMRTVLGGVTVLALSVLGEQAARCQTSQPTERAPEGWFLTGSNPQIYRTGVDSRTMHDGLPSAFLTSVARGNGFGTLMQSISAANYTGKRVRGWVRVQDVRDWAGLWMRVDRGKSIVAFDNMQNREMSGTQPWNPYDVVLDIPADATSISFGILLTGAGRVWLSDVSVEVVGNDTPTTGTTTMRRTLPITPVNLNFKD